MSNLDLISLLERFIINHSLIKLEDKAVVSRICSLIRISSEPGLINESHRNQVEMEAGVFYLANRYGQIVEKYESIFNDHKNGVLVTMGEKTDDGYKWTRKNKEEFLQSTDSRYAILLETLTTARRLLYSIRDLSTVVLGRNQKLEQLSINYRRETEVDRHT